MVASVLPCSVEIKVEGQSADRPSLTTHNKVAFGQNTGSAVVKKLSLGLPSLTQVIYIKQAIAGCWACLLLA